MKTFEEWNFKNPFKSASLKSSKPIDPDGVDPWGEEDWRDLPEEIVDNKSIQFFRDKTGEYFFLDNCNFHGPDELYIKSGIFKLMNYGTEVSHSEEKNDKILIHRKVLGIFIYSPTYDITFPIIGDSPKCRIIENQWDIFKQKFEDLKETYKKLENL